MPPPASERDYSHGYTRIDKTAGSLVDSSVPTYGYNTPITVGRAFARQLGGMARPLGVHDISLRPEYVPHHTLQSRPGASA